MFRTVLINIACCNGKTKTWIDFCEVRMISIIILIRFLLYSFHQPYHRNTLPIDAEIMLASNICRAMTTYANKAQLIILWLHFRITFIIFVFIIVQAHASRTRVQLTDDRILPAGLISDSDVHKCANFLT